MTVVEYENLERAATTSRERLVKALTYAAPQIVRVLRLAAEVCNEHEGDPKRVPTSIDDLKGAIRDLMSIPERDPEVVTDGRG